MKVLFCGLKNEYGNPKRGKSFELQNFYGALEKMPGVTADFFAVDEELAAAGREQMNQRLKDRVLAEKPDLLFCFLFTEELEKDTIRFITKNTQTKTLNWFADDHWRFPIFSKFWAPVFSAVATTDSQAVAKYKQLGVRQVIHTQWGVNPRLFYPQAAGEASHELTFVGLNYSVRQGYIDSLEQQGLPVEAFGTGWPLGTIPKERAAKIWSASKLNLNFTESSAYGAKFFLKLLAKLVVKKELGRYRFDGRNFFANLESALAMRRRQIKSRNFEIPACGGFLLTGDADNLGEYYRDGEEIVIFRDKRDLAEKCRYYLEHEAERQRIARAGYERTLKEHTYEQRFTKIFQMIF